MGFSSFQRPNRDIIRTTITEIQAIITHFGKAISQLANLRESMKITLNKVFAFILECRTRWGTQYGCANSVRRVKLVLMHFAEQYAIR